MNRSITPLSLVIDQACINRYAELTGDANPLHLDATFAAGTRMGGIVAHGTLSSNLIWQMFDAAGLLVADVQVRFLVPVRPGDVITAEAEPLEEPPVMRVASCGLTAVPFQSLMPVMP